MQPQPEAAQGPVRLLAQLPTGISCVKVDELTLRDGIGCGQMGSSRPGQTETLYYNLRQQARTRQANVVILNGPPRHDSWEGCHSNGLMAEASLYRCAFAGEGATEP
ncbi:MAG: hypothetical protein CVV27_02240 [Candidatus Melainabacteria bacterium HGW-Melainabacteria-1]|nr:MAG: hypothetical protein CVV27_02240 [Candidatus Melainabacteria bacterium HGW-Melainabacteria-1]